MLNTILCTLRNINDHYGNLLLLLVAFGTLGYAYREYSLKKEPLVIPEIQHEIKDDSWYFSLSLVNLGMTPAIAQIQAVTLKIGDETYPTVFHNSILLSGSGGTANRQIIMPIGFINAVGRKKIIGHEYRENRCEVHIEIKSKAIGENEFRYNSTFDYQIDVSRERPVFIMVNEKIHS
jgi:hypothetical protein